MSKCPPTRHKALYNKEKAVEDTHQGFLGRCGVEGVRPFLYIV